MTFTSKRIRSCCTHWRWQWNVRLACFLVNNNVTNIDLISTPLYQVLAHALAEKSNQTKFTLLFSNVTEKDILLREELDALRKRYPDTFDLVYLLDKPEKGWTGAYHPPFFLANLLPVLITFQLSQVHRAIYRQM